MATTFTTTITSMYTLQTPDPDYIVNVLWQVEGVDGEYTGSIGGNTQFSSADQTGPVIPYADLTQATVLNWVWANGVDKQATEDALTAQIDLQKNPVTATGTPWGQA